jgi:hypothetical protein
METGYLQHGSGSGPFRTEAVSVKHECLDQYYVYYECRWRKLHLSMKGHYIVYRGQKIKCQVEGT